MVSSLARTGSRPVSLVAAVSSAIAWTSRMCRPQNSAICSKVSELFSTSHEAVAWGIRGWATADVSVFRNEMGRPFRSGRLGARCNPRGRPGQGALGIHCDITRVALHALDPLDDIGIALEVEIRVAGNVGVGEQADV